MGTLNSCEMAMIYLQRLRDDAGSLPTPHQQSGITKVIKAIAKHRGTMRSVLKAIDLLDKLPGAMQG